MSKFSLKGFFENNRNSKIFAICFAVLCWVVVIMTSQDTRTRTIANVPVDVDLLAADLKSMGLNPIDSGNFFVRVEVRGQTTNVAKITAQQLHTTVKVSGITESGWYELPVVPAETSEDFEIVSYYPATIKVHFDRLSSITFDLKPLVTGATTPENYALDEIYTTPQRVTVSGPQSELERVAQCVVQKEFSAPISRTDASIVPIKLLDVADRVIDPDERHLTMEVLDAQLVVPVLRIRGLPLEVGFVNVPGGFPIEELHELMNMTDYAVTVAGPVNLVESYKELRLGYIDLKNLAPDSSVYSFEVELPSAQFRNLDGVHSVAVTFNTENWEKQSFNVSHFQITNSPKGYDVNLLTNVLNNITIVGDKDVLEGMTADDIVVELDFSERDISVGRFSFPVKISVPTKGLVWAVGDYSVIIQLTETQQ